MSWSERPIARRVLLAVLPAVALSGCFRPMLAETGEAAQLRGRIDLPPINGRNGYYLNQVLVSRLGRPQAPDYRLEVRLSFRERGLAIEPDGSVTRRTIIAIAVWRLFRDGTRKPVLNGQELSQSGFNSDDDLYSVRVTRRDIERRLARELGERIARQVLARTPAPVPAAVPAPEDAGTPDAS